MNGALDIKELLFYVYLVVILFTVVVGIARYKMLDYGSRLIFWLLTITLASESLSRLIADKTVVYHFYAVAEIFMISAYGINTIRTKYRRSLIIGCAIVYSLLGIVNTMFFQPLHQLNYNFIILETFLEIVMSLYCLYRILVDDSVKAILRYVHFWFWSFLLLYFSATFFFWPCLKVLYKAHSVYYDVAVYAQISINLFVYTGMGAIVFFYPKMIRDEG